MIVSRETSERLDAYEALLRKWNPAINLVAPASLCAIRQRHFDDSAQLDSLAGFHSGHLIDLGSGGGLPGVILAILNAENPVTVTLLESDKRKCSFLQTVRRDLSLDRMEVKNVRIEELPPASADFVTSRALAPISLLLPMLQRHLADTGEAWLLKGRRWRDELDAAQPHWHFDLKSFPSQTDPESAILRVRNIRAHDPDHRSR